MTEPDDDDFRVERTGFRGRGCLFNLGLLVVSILVALVVGELAFRFLHVPRVPSIPHDVYHHTRPADSTARWASWHDEFDTLVSFNSLSFRGSEPDLEREHLWIFFGDSMVEAMQVTEDETACRHLEVLLGENHTVLNAGVGGYSPILIRLRLEELLKEIAPAVPEKVILGLFPNDLEEEYVYRYAAYEDRQGRIFAVTPGILRGPLGKLRTWAFKNSVIVQLIQKSFGAVGDEGHTKVEPYIPSEKVLYPFRTVWTDAEKQVWSKIFRSIGDVNRICDDHGIELVLVIIPPGHQVSPDAWKTGKLEMYESIKDDYMEESTSFQDEIQKRSRRIGVPTLDLLPDFKEHPSPEELYFDYDGHWTAEGNQFAAEVIHKKLVELENEEENP